jgi:hypothetical protein
MAFTVIPTVTGQSSRTWQVYASADADEFVDIPHGYGVVPLIVQCSGISGSVGQSLANSLAGWSIDSAATDATNIRVRKSVQAGSAGSACLVVVALPVQ